MVGFANIPSEYSPSAGFASQTLAPFNKRCGQNTRVRVVGFAHWRGEASLLHSILFYIRAFKKARQNNSELLKLLEKVLQNSRRVLVLTRSVRRGATLLSSPRSLTLVRGAASCSAMLRIAAQAKLAPSIAEGSLREQRLLAPKELVIAPSRRRFAPQTAKLRFAPKRSFG